MQKRAGEAEAIQHVLNQALLGSLVGTPVAQATGGAEAPVSNTTLAGVLGGAAGLSGGVGAGKALAQALGGRGRAILPVLGGAAGAVGLPAAGGALAKRVAKKHKAEKRANLEPAAEGGGNALIALGRELAEVGSVRAATALGQRTEKRTPEELAQIMLQNSKLQKSAAFQLGYVSHMGKQAGSGNPFSAFGAIVGALKNIKSFDNAGVKAVRGVESQLPTVAKTVAPVPVKPAVAKVPVPEDNRAAEWAAKQQAMQANASPAGGLLTQMLKDRAAKATGAMGALAPQAPKNNFAFK